MAEIVLGVGSSHGPTIQSTPERWLALGAKDFEDPRYSYDDALKSAPADIEEQIAPERMQARYEARLDSALWDRGPHIGRQDGKAEGVGHHPGDDVHVGRSTGSSTVRRGELRRQSRLRRS